MYRQKQVHVTHRITTVYMMSMRKKAVHFYCSTTEVKIYSTHTEENNLQFAVSN